MRHFRHGCLVLALAVVVLEGCSPWATYPPVETRAAQALASPTFEPVPTLMAMAIEYTLAEYLPGKDLPINLPQGADRRVYDAVFARLKGEPLQRPMMQIGEPAIHVKEVRTRAFDVQVDVVIRGVTGSTNWSRSSCSARCSGTRALRARVRGRFATSPRPSRTTFRPRPLNS